MTPDPIEIARSWWGDKEAERMAAAMDRPSVVNDDAEPAEPEPLSDRDEDHYAARAENRDSRAADRALDGVEWSERRRRAWRAEK